MIPLLVRAEAIVRPRRELRVRRHAEKRVEVVDEVDDPVHLGRNLLLGAEDVGVVLRDVPHAREAVQRPRELVAVERRRLGVAKRKIAVAAQLGAEQEHVSRAVHGLHPVRLVVGVAGTRNMFSRNFSQWPDVIQSALS